MRKAGTAIAHARHRRGCTQQELARLLKTHQPDVWRWEQQESVHVSTLVAIANVLRVRFIVDEMGVDVVLREEVKL